MQATPGDTNPVSGLTVTCTSPDGELTSTLVEAFPGNGPPTTVLNFTNGLTSATAQVGQYVDQLLGAGGTGQSPVSQPRLNVGSARCQIMPSWPGRQAPWCAGWPLTLAPACLPLLFARRRCRSSAPRTCT